MIAITTIGLWLFIVPGVYLALRLFWADEFALIHDRNPIASLQASWVLTRGAVGGTLVFQLLVGLVACVILAAAFGIMQSILAVPEALGWIVVGRPSLVRAFASFFFFLLAYGAIHAIEVAMFYTAVSTKTEHRTVIGVQQQGEVSGAVSGG